MHTGCVSVLGKAAWNWAIWPIPGYFEIVTQPSTIPRGGRALNENDFVALTEQMSSIVESSHLFKSLDPEGRKAILESGYLQSFNPADVLMKQDEAGDAMFLIFNGTVAVETDTAGGKIQLAELGRGACVGEVSVLMGSPRTATVTAMTEVDAISFARHRIERVLAEYPKVREVLLKLVESRAHDTIEKIIG
ncbi:MAG: CRP/FNR family cyclic AMP-dependent transcriptional regulator [Polyangiales bacterium]|jgi:CRP/FNR family cyclic AMP-dependent transcriptional regulator